MDKKQKFENFLESLKGNGQDVLIESVKKGFQTCMEVTGRPYPPDDLDPNDPDVMKMRIINEIQKSQQDRGFRIIFPADDLRNHSYEFLSELKQLVIGEGN